MVIFAAEVWLYLVHMRASVGFLIRDVVCVTRFLLNPQVRFFRELMSYTATL